MALMNVFASLGGVVAPILIGVLRERAGAYEPAMVLLAVQFVLASLLLLAFGKIIARRSTNSLLKNIRAA